MTKFITGLSLLLVTYFLYGVYINQYDMSVIPKTLRSENPSGFYDYKGVMNVHSSASIGSSNVKFILDSARSAGLDFVILTDLNTFSPTVPGNYYNNLLVLDGKKYSYLDSRILIATSEGEINLGSNLGETQVKLADLLSQDTASNKNNLMLLAHPFNTGFSWTSTIPEGIDGTEVINLKTLSMQAWKQSKLSTLWSLLIYPFNSRLALTRLFVEPAEEWALVDKVSQSRHFNAYSGAEASARALPFGSYWVRFPSYQRLFEISSNHVILKAELTGNFKSDKQKIFSALKNGHFYVSMDILGDPTGFIATMEDKSKTYLMGANVPLSKSTTLKVKLPSTPKHFYEIVVFKNGERLKIFNSIEAILPIKEPGNYRVQVRVSPFWPVPDGKKWITWIYTNNFYVQ